MLVKTRQEFEEVLDAFDNETTVFFDVEATGLKTFFDLDKGGDQIIGLALYFPSVMGEDNQRGVAYYLPFRHGVGKFSEQSVDSFPKTWRSNDKKYARMQEIYEAEVMADVVASNLPIEWLDEIKEVWLKPDKLVAHNAQFDLLMLRRENFPLHPCVEDTEIYAYAWSSDWRGQRWYNPITGKTEMGNKRLKWLAQIFNAPGAGETEQGLDDAFDKLYEILKEKGGYANRFTDSKRKGFLWALHPQDVAYYATYDVILTHHLYLALRKRLADWQQLPFAEWANRVQNTVLYRMSDTGFSFDKAAADRMAQKQERIAELEEKMQSMTGRNDFNPGSWQQVQAYFEGVGLDIPNTKSKTLESYVDADGLIPLLLEYRNLTKLLKTYVLGWIEKAPRSNYTIHPELRFNTVTGRLTSSGEYGNLQTFPREIKSDVAPKLLVLPHNPNWCIYELDYSNLEVYIAAWIAENLLTLDPNKTLTTLLVNGTDMHAYTRDVVGIPEIFVGGEVNAQSVKAWMHAHEIDTSKFETDEDVLGYFYKKICRSAGKTVNFGMMYGGGTPAVQRSLGVSRDQAQAIVDGWHASRPAVRRAMKYMQAKILTPRPRFGSDDQNRTYLYLRYPPLDGFQMLRIYNGYPTSQMITTSEGRRVQINPLRAAARDGFNSIVQGTAGHIMLNTCLRIAERFSRDEMDIHLTVHDSIIVSFDPANEAEFLPLMQHFATDYETVPNLKVDIEKAPPGMAWGYKKELDLA